MWKKCLSSVLPEPVTRFVDPKAYARLITSRAALERCDDPEAGLLGVFDPVTQMRFVVQEVAVVKMWEVNSQDAL